MQGFTTTALITGIVCYVLGMLVGWLINRSNNKPREKQAYDRGKKEMTDVMAREKKVISQELNGKLESMRDSLVATYAAYEEAVQSVEDRLSPGAKDRLSLDYKSASRQIGYQGSSDGEDDRSPVEDEEQEADDLTEKKSSESSEEDLSSPEAEEESEQDPDEDDSSQSSFKADESRVNGHPR